MKPFQSLTKDVNQFRDALHWREYHHTHPKEMAIGISTEAAEILEHFRFRTDDMLTAYIEDHRHQIGEEIADTIYCCLALANDLGIDLDTAFHEKLAKTKERYATHPKDLDQLQ